MQDPVRCPGTPNHPTHALTFNPDVPSSDLLINRPLTPALISGPVITTTQALMYTPVPRPSAVEGQEADGMDRARPPWGSPLRLSRAKTADQSAIVPAQPTELLNHAGLLASPSASPAPTPTGSLQTPMRIAPVEPPTTKQLHLVLGALHPTDTVSSWAHAPGGREVTGIRL